ncbi:Hypothetical protein SCF082_LOCUS16903 [Durusdinium trenchii]|uniref:Uncharacterized protein n=1 Tax=Durusdinium trenchii TaxID=1381693 RepID=A0ABP0KE55_9DINO
MYKTAVLLLCSSLAASQAVVDDYEYDPAKPDEPMDVASQAVSKWLKDEVVVPRKKDGWQNNFCLCVQNGNIASWYQMASAMYVVDTCSATDGFVLRSGHMQDRHVHPLQAMMACDTLKLVSYCLSHEAPEALPMWKPMCDHAHYTVPSCDVVCGGAQFTSMSALLMAAVGLLLLR